MPAKLSGGSAARLQAQPTRAMRKSPVQQIVAAVEPVTVQEVIDNAYAIHGANDQQLTDIAKAGVGRALVEVFRAGMAMLEYHNTRGNGRFVEWLKQDVKIPVSTAYKYMNCAKVVPWLYERGSFHGMETFTLEQVLRKGYDVGVLIKRAPPSLPEPKDKMELSQSEVRELVDAVLFFDSVVREQGWGDAEALERAYRKVLWSLQRKRR